MTDFKPMLAKDGDPSVLTYPLFVQPKLDGIRASVVDGRLLSRTLKPIPNAEIRAALERPEFEGLDGEILVGPANAADVYRRTASFVMSPSKTSEPWTYHVFDRWNTDLPAAARLLPLADAWMPAFMSQVETVKVNSPAEVETYEALALENGFEGVILRDPDAAYKFGRSGKKGPLIKVKRFIDFEAEVIGVFEEMHNVNEAVVNELGRTSRSTAKAGLVGKGTLGGLIVRGINGPAEGVEFRVGTGFDHATREALWGSAEILSPHGKNHDAPRAVVSRDGLNGRVAKIKSFPIGTKDKPRHPVFLGWRDMEVDG